MSETTPERSKGARMERAAMRNYLRRQIKTAFGECNITLNNVLNWVLERQKRFNDKAGGLGRK